MFYAEILTVIRTKGQSFSIGFATHMTHPLLKMKRSVLFIMYNWLNAFYCKMNGKYSITSSLEVTHDVLRY